MERSHAIQEKKGSRRTERGKTTRRVVLSKLDLEEKPLFGGGGALKGERSGFGKYFWGEK